MPEQLPPLGTLELLDSGFRVVPNGEEVARIAWDDVREIAAYKVDLWAYDQICLEFRMGDSGPWIEITEEHTGFRELTAAVEARFPSIPPGW